ncbi:MAG: hypothetical protein IIY07_03770, partial [Thermoguttaceae bacterium]|nr:hypothetical protein [Thermoguttaceae bacterium]
MFFWKRIIKLWRRVRQGLHPLEIDKLSGRAVELSPSPQPSAAPSVAAGRSFLEFLNDLPDASRLAFVYATASSEKRIDFYRDDARQEFIVSHRLH